MLYSCAVIFSLGLIIMKLFSKIKIPGLVGLIILGMFLGSANPAILSKDFMNLSSELRSLALVIILSRAGLALKLDDLKTIGKPALLMSFVPATCEILACTLIAPLLFKISYLDAAIMGCVLAAVSPAVIVPHMLKIIKEGYGNKNKVPQLIMAGASIDDIFVIIIFTSLLGITQKNTFNMFTLLQIPLSIISGIIIGMLCGLGLVKLFKYVSFNIYAKTLLMLSTSFILLHLEKILPSYLSMSALLAVMAMGAIILYLDNKLANSLSDVYEAMWLPASIILFVLVGTSINFTSNQTNLISVLLLVLLALCFRMGGVLLALRGSKLNKKEKYFCMYSYLPKATVQAALASIPLSSGLASGNVILVVGVSSILITAPIGSWLIDYFYQKHLLID